MFKAYADYKAAAQAALAGQPKGTGYKNHSGVIFLLGDTLCYAEHGDLLEDCSQCDQSAFDEQTLQQEWECLQSPVYIQRFTPEAIDAYLAAN